MAALARIRERLVYVRDAQPRDSRAAKELLIESTSLPPSGPGQSASPGDDVRQDRKARSLDRDALFLP